MNNKIINNHIDGAGEQLENAFQMFNKFSEELAGSYSGLESQVAQLSTALTKERDKRLIQLAEKELLANRLESLLDALPAGIVVLDSAGYVVQTNQVAREMLEFKLDGANFGNRRWKDIAEKALVTVGGELRLKNGRSINLSACALGDYPGKIILLSDVTETYRLQNMLNRQQRLSSLGEMIASLAHQIRTPLAAALLYITGLNHQGNDEKEKRYFSEKAKERLCHLERMVDDMLLFAKGDVSNSEHINVEKIFTQLKCCIEPIYKSQKIKLVIDEKLNDITIRANSDALVSAIQNVIDNAVSACADIENSSAVHVERVVEVRAFLNEENQFEINITDNGCGMSEEIRERVLEPFFTTKPEGTGLGLAVVNATVNRYEGEMDIVSREGAGSSINMRFPLSTPSSMLVSNLTSNYKNETHTNNCGGKKQQIQEILQNVDVREGEL